MAKCPYAKLCRHYRKDSFTCNGGNKRYCGIFRFVQTNITKIKENKYLLKVSHK